MIDVESNSEFTISTSDLILTLSMLDVFDVKIWITGSEIPFEYSHEDDFLFMQESLKVSHDNMIDYIFYDLINTVRVSYARNDN